MNRKFEFDDWLEAQRQKAKNEKRAFKKVFIGERSYPHLDGKLHYPRIGQDVVQAARLKDVVSNYDRLAKHGFLPFIKNAKRQRKFREPPNDYEYSTIRGDRDQKKFPHIKSRPIMYASHTDACIFSFYSYLVQQKYEEKLITQGLENNVIAYRSIDGKNNVDFAKEVFNEMQKLTEYECMMVDVKGFFDNIYHPKLEERWDQLIAGGFKANKDHHLIFERITKYLYINFEESIKILKLHRRPFLARNDDCLRICSLNDYNTYIKKTARINNTDKGIPQGSPISGVLANLYLIDFDTAMKSNVVDDCGGIYQRYSDDIFVLCPLGSVNRIYENMQDWLLRDRLALGSNKTEAFRMVRGANHLENITNEIEPKGNVKRKETQYLGFHFDGKVITFRPSTLSKHLRGRKKPDYLKGAYVKTSSSKIARQMNKVRRIVKAK